MHLTRLYNKYRALDPEGLFAAEAVGVDGWADAEVEAAVEAGLGWGGPDGGPVGGAR